MAYTQAIPLGTGNASSDSIVVGDGSVHSIVFSGVGVVGIYADIGGTSVRLGEVSKVVPGLSIQGPVTYKLIRENTHLPSGVGYFAGD